MAGVRDAVASALVAAIVAASPGTRAQSCHVPPPQAALEPGFRMAIAQETARFESSRYEGHYQGLVLRGSMTRGWFFATAALPAYRIVRNGLAERGLGDVLLHAQAELVSTTNDATRGGVALSATLPTGEARDDLGMGHPMLMPGVWVTVSVDDLLVGAHISYAKSLTGDDAHHHGAMGPVVAPMSSSELEATLSASVPIHPSVSLLRLLAGADGAVPVFEEGGAARTNAMVGVLLGSRVRSSVELHLPIAAEPSVVKLVIDLSVVFP
jgi:hypothetical protein